MITITRLTEREEQYCLYRIKGYTQREAYKKAYPNNHQKNEYIDAYASRLESKDKIKARLEKLRDKMNAKCIMSIEEALKNLTEMALDKSLSAKDRRGAIDLILKSQGAYTNNINLSGNVSTRIEEYIKKVETENEYGN